MVPRRRTARIGCRLAGRWLRCGGAVPIEVADISAHGLYLNDHDERAALPIGELQQIEVDLPMATVRLVVVPRHATRGEWSRGVGLQIYAASELDRNLWLACFRQSRVPLRG